MIYLVLALSIGVFLICMKLLGVVESVRPIFATSHSALAAMRSTELIDEQKEAAVRAATIHILGSFLSFTVRIALTLAVPAALVAAGSAVHLYTMENAVSAASGWTFLIVSTLVVTAAFALFAFRDRAEKPS